MEKIMVNLDAISALNNRWPENKINPSLDRIRMLTDLLANPQDSFKTIHIAGTNGKSSTSRMIERLLRGLELRTGLFTSPHLIHPRERIEIDGQMISEEVFNEVYSQIEPYLNLVDEKFPDSPLTFFEVLTGMSFLTFAENPVDVVSLEVGMGGSWDSTNVVTPEVCVITPIDLDHQEFLGNTISLIAKEKAGIIKENIPIVMSKQLKDAKQVIEQAARNLNSPIYREGIEFDVLERSIGLGGQQLKITTPFSTYEDLFLPMYGKYQASNAACALMAVESFIGKDIDQEIVHDAFRDFISPGRLQVVKRNPTIVIDAAHNEAGIRATKEALKESFNFDKKIVIVGFMKDKSITEMIKELDDFADYFIVTKTQSNRAIEVQDLVSLFQKNLNKKTEIIETKNTNKALKEAIKLVNAQTQNCGIIVLGSIVLAGEVLKLVKGDL